MAERFGKHVNLVPAPRPEGWSDPSHEGPTNTTTDEDQASGEEDNDVGHDVHQDDFVAQIVAQIKSKWNRATADIIDIGRDLTKLKEHLRQKGLKFGSIFENNGMPFGQREAQRLMAIAAHPIISDATHESHLPPSSSTLYLLTTVPDDELNKGFADGTINSGTEREDVEEILKRIAEEGHYRIKDLYDAFGVINKFRAKRDSQSIAPFLLDEMNENDGDHSLDLHNFPEVVQFVADLHTACVARQQEREEMSKQWQEQEAQEEQAMAATPRRHKRAKKVNGTRGM
jgi:hypothetical protein